MKYGLRTPSFKKSFSARTSGAAKRAVKRAIIPGYGKKGMGILHPKRALYNKVYRRTTFSIFDIAKESKRTRNASTNTGCCLMLLFGLIVISLFFAI